MADEQAPLSAEVLAPAKGNCLTHDAVFTFDIRPASVSLAVDLPGELHLTEGEAKELEQLLHNGAEYALAKFWHRLQAGEASD